MLNRDLRYFHKCFFKCHIKLYYLPLRMHTISSLLRCDSDDHENDYRRDYKYISFFSDWLLQHLAR